MDASRCGRGGERKELRRGVCRDSLFWRREREGGKEKVRG